MGLLAEALFVPPHEVEVSLHNPRSYELRFDLCPGYSRLKLDSWKTVLSWEAKEDWQEQVMSYRLLRVGSGHLIGDGDFNGGHVFTITKGSTINFNVDFNVEGVGLDLFQKVFKELQETCALEREKAPATQSVDWRRIVEI